jgi:hypothetical protein
MLRSAEWAALDAALSKASSATSISHPKMAKLEELVVAHFRAAEQQSRHARLPGVDSDVSSFDTRAIIFTQYRDSVTEIVESLKAFAPLVKAVAFVGQSKGLTQKQQLQIMKEFKTGACNTLVATSIGEEGLDVGEVDLIVCFDAQASPQRMVQRMGRTGRRRKGRIVLLLSPGEKFTQKRAETKNLSMNKAVADGAKFRCYHPQASLFPDDVVPECLEVEFPRFESFVAPAGRRAKSKSAAVALSHAEDTTAWNDAIQASYSAQSNFLSEHELQYLNDYYAFSVDDLVSGQIEVSRSSSYPTPVGAVPHSSLCLSYLNLMNAVRESDFAAETVFEEMGSKLAAAEELLEPAPKRRKISEKIKPIEDDRKFVSVEHMRREEERYLLDAVPGVSRPMEHASDMLQAGNNGEDIDQAFDEEDIQLYPEPTPALRPPSPSYSPLVPIETVSPNATNSHSTLRKPSLFKRSSQLSPPASQSSKPLDTGIVHVPTAPILPFNASFGLQGWFIPEIEIVEDPSPTSGLFAVPPNRAPRKMSPMKNPIQVSPSRLLERVEDAFSPVRGSDLASLTSPPRQHRRLRRGVNNDHLDEPIDGNEASFNEEEALIASLNNSVRDSSPVSPSPEKDRPSHFSKSRSKMVTSLFELEPELSGDEEDHEDEEEDHEEDDSSWLTDSPDSSMNADVNMQAIYRQSLLSQMSPTQSGKRPGGEGFVGTPKRHNHNHFKMRFLDATAKDRHDAALRGALDPYVTFKVDYFRIALILQLFPIFRKTVSQKSGAIRNLFQGTPPSQILNASNDFEDEIVSSFQEKKSVATFNGSAAPIAVKPSRMHFSGRNPAHVPQTALTDIARSSVKFSAPRLTNVPPIHGAWNPPTPTFSSTRPQQGGPHNLPQMNRLVQFAPMNRSLPSEPVSAAYEDPEFDSALAELDIDAILLKRGK